MKPRKHYRGYCKSGSSTLGLGHPAGGGEFSEPMRFMKLKEFTVPEPFFNVLF